MPQLLFHSVCAGAAADLVLNKVSVPKVLGENDLLGNLKITPYNLN